LQLGLEQITENKRASLAARQGRSSGPEVTFRRNFLVQVLFTICVS